MTKKRLVYAISTLVIIAGVIVTIIYMQRNDSAAESSNASVSQPETTTQQTEPEVPTGQETKEEPAPPSFDKTKFSTTDPTSPWVVVNKQRPLPNNFVPPDLVSIRGSALRAETATNLDELMSAASRAGNPMNILSAYRSYATQSSTYQMWVSQDGAAAADTYSARPGYSEHQTGLAADLGNGVCNLEICFGDTPAGQWLAENAHNYGFIIRYPEGKQDIVGYQYEPWHLRYVGKELAAELYTSKLTMEEFFGLGAAPSY